MKHNEMNNKRSLTTILSSIAALAMFNSSPVYAADWVLVTESLGGDKFYIDADSFERRGPIAWYWEQRVYAVPDGNVAIHKTYFSIDCRSGVSRLRKIITYNSQGEVLDSIDDGGKGLTMSYVPGSVGEGIFRAVCNR